MAKDSFKDKLLARIKHDQLEPKPRWQFLLKNYTLYVVGVLSLLIGSAAVSVMIYLFKFNDWHLYGQTKTGFWEFFILTLPYFWFIFLALFILIVYYNLKHTQKGYRYPGILLVVASIALSIILGTVFFAWGLGEKIDNILGRQAPFYSHVFNPQIDFWSQPEDGRLMGLVVEVLADDQIVVLDREFKEWAVTVKAPETLNQPIILRQPIRLLGQQIAPYQFVAEKSMTMMRPGQGFFRNLENRPRPRKMMRFLIDQEMFPEASPDRPLIEEGDKPPLFLPKDRGSLLPPGTPAPTPMPYY